MLAQPLSAVRAARPALTLFPRAIVEAVLLAEGPIGSAQSVAKQLGLRSRFQLARMLKREGLPPLHRLAAWATLLSWVLQAERRGVSLSTLAARSRRNPSACYRLVKDLTGQPWSEVRRRGTAWVERQFLRELARCPIPERGAPRPEWSRLPKLPPPSFA